MKKIIISFLATTLVFFSLVFSLGAVSFNREDEFKVAMVTDFSDVNDASFNQACYEGAKKWCSQYDIKFNYYKPSSISLAERIRSLKLAIDRGYDVILCPGFALGKAIREVAPNHPDVKFIGLDITQSDFGEDFVLTDNISVFNYHEEIAGYLAGYGAVKEGYRRLGFLGGMETAPVIRFGFGYVQGVDAAAKELEANIDLKYVYGKNFFGDSDTYARMDSWYKSSNIEIVFACGGSIYTSVALAAKENGGYMIGVDSDQAPIIDRDYGEGICITSAMKDIRRTVINKLEALYKDNVWDQGFNYLGLISNQHPEENYVQLPIETWRMKNFTIEDYKSLVSDIMLGIKEVSDTTNINNLIELLSEYTHFDKEPDIK